MMLKYFGLVKSEDDSETGQIPLWQGVTKRQRLLSIAISLTLTIIMYFATSWLLESSEGFARYTPGMLACQTLLLCGVISERALLRAN
ncbi:hypothetical protein [Glutamicibacter halophytocola]|uniref:Uncharacterized protein n=1 Tax=Glutamicibacter halophytocola TaxID=1933880 RepID=A0A5B8IJ11_9MICC|nr:hypothetical protein [Glutamicibacter halophytocola]QDY66232.1 hypothetical protein FQA45_07845 [Glutamicibacter halophytocola]UUX58335.1 hypothetical protein NUH22_13660 [Glutamicibacter halophytocola]